MNSYFAEMTTPQDDVLTDWRWLIGSTFQVWRVTKMGDAFVRDPRDGSIHFLDTISGQVERIAESETALVAALISGANVDRWLMPEIVDGQMLLGMIPQTNECLSFKHPPSLGGELDPDNLEVCDIVTHFSIAGQLHRQIKDLPPGTPIRDINIVPPVSKTRPWWRFW